MPFPLRVILIGFSAIILAACVKDEIAVNDIKYDLQPEIGLPIASTRIMAARVIDYFDDDGIVTSGTDGSLSLIYSDSVPDVDLARFFKVPAQEFDRSIDLTILEQAELIGNGSVSIVENSQFSLQPDKGDRLDSIRFDSGLFELDITSEGDLPISGSLQIISADKSTAFTISFQDVVPPISIQNQSDFSNIIFLLENNAEISNGIQIQYDVTFNYQAGGTYGPVEFDLKLTDLTVRHAGGYIAPRRFKMDTEQIALQLFSQPFAGNISIEDPKINFYLANGFGIGLGLDVQDISGITASGETLFVPGSQIDDFPTMAPAPTLASVANSSFSIANENINPSLTDFLAFQPKTLLGNFAIDINPNNDQSAFVSNQSNLAIAFEAEIPIFGSISDFLLIDTTSVDLGDLIKATEENANILSVDIKLLVANGFPFDAGVQIVFTDSDFNALDSLFTAPSFIFGSAPVNLFAERQSMDYGRAVGQTEILTEIALSRERALNLGDATHIIVKVFGGTSSNGDHPIRLFDSDFFDVKLGANAKLDFNE